MFFRQPVNERCTAPPGTVEGQQFADATQCRLMKMLDVLVLRQALKLQCHFAKRLKEAGVTMIMRGH
ncbi:hypothetical protein D3C84_1137110 [compost metagenome]